MLVYTLTQLNKDLNNYFVKIIFEHLEKNILYGNVYGIPRRNQREAVDWLQYNLLLFQLPCD